MKNKPLLHQIFERQLAFGIFFLNLFGNRRRSAALAQQLAEQLPGTLGHKMWQNMVNNQLQLVPGYEHHDLKHALLGYPMQPPDEIRMQAFMFGNAGFSVYNTVIFLTFVAYTPETWGDLYYHYRLGQRVRPIAHYQIADIIGRDLESIRDEIGLASAKMQVAVEVYQTFPG